MILDYEKNFNDADFGIGNGIGLCKLRKRLRVYTLHN